MTQLNTFTDFCAGIGGFRVALEALGLTCVFSSEINDDSVKTYNNNFNESNVASDLTKLIPKSIPDFDVICAGFPCQPFSIAGKRLGLEDERSGVLSSLMNIIKVKKPKIIFLENVKNFENFGGGSLLDSTKKTIESIGYTVFHSVLDSSQFKVPQVRKRLFIVAFRKDLDINNFKFPIGSSKIIPFRTIINTGDYSIPITEKWKEYLDYYTGKKTIDQLSFEPPKTRVSIERADKNINLNDCIFQMRSSGVRALSIDKPLPTLAVSISGGGAMIPIYSKERRHLNLIELKRLMGFPDNYLFPVSRTSAIKQLANAVCPPVIESIMSKVIKTIVDGDEEPDQKCLPL
jgi:DNA (cytosine-5)-methyltransferase 1